MSETLPAWLDLDGLILDLAVEDGWNLTALDLGYPQVREVSSLRPDMSGTDDMTSLFGARVVSMTLLGFGVRREMLDAVAPFTQPSARPYLYIDMDGEIRRILLRPSGVAHTYVAPSNMVSLNLQWVAPDGVVEDETATVAIADPSADAFGRSYPLVPSRSYLLTSAPAGAATCRNAGNVATYPLIRLYGEATNPKIRNLTTGATLGFLMSVGDGEWLEIDTRERTVRLNGISSQSRYDRLDVLDSTWLTLQPGVNHLWYTCDTSGVNARAEIIYRSTYL
jgi:hypothetical protein